MKKTRRTVFLGALALSLSLAGCWRSPGDPYGESDNFRVLDANHDNDVDRYEWENLQGSAFAESLGFRYSDCDSDGRLTRHEYSNGYMGRMRCPVPYLYEDTRDDAATRASESAGSTELASSTHPDDDQGEDYRAGPLIVRADEPLEMLEAPGRSDFHAAQIDVQTLLSRQQPPRAGRYSETDLTAAKLQRLRLSSTPLTDTIFVSHTIGGQTVPGFEARRIFPLVVCKLANDNPDLRITLADLQVIWHENGHAYRTRVLKTLWLNPRSTQLLHVWFGRAVASAECRLLHARGQPAG
jgi:hypothetical protein